MKPFIAIVVRFLSGEFEWYASPAMSDKRSRKNQLEQQREALLLEKMRSQPWSPDMLYRTALGGHPRIQIFHLPSFSPSTFWEISQAKDGWLLYRASVVSSPYGEPLKVIGYDRIAIPSTDLERDCRRILSLSLPIAPYLESMGGLDGVITQVRVLGHLSSHMQFQWWSDPPEGWRPLVQIVDEMLATFQAVFGGNAAET